MIIAPKKTGILFFPAFDWAISPDHPEREERLLYTRDQIFEEGLLDIEGIIEYPPRITNYANLLRAHICVPGPEEITTESHLISAGGCNVIADAVLNKEIQSGFAIVRPPGHHAMRITHGSRGFCNINIESVMVEYIRKKYNIKRIAIVDTDAHHADGTQDIYYNDPDVLHISIHQDGRTLFPGTGFIGEAGGPAAYGTTLNVPVPPHTSDEGLLYIMNNLVLPVLNEFKPEIVINAAGQDNHYSDPLTNMNISARGYAKLNELLKPDIVVLEGGYSIEGALPYVNTGIILALAGLDYSHVLEPDLTADKIKQSPKITEDIKKTVDQLLLLFSNRTRIDLNKIFGKGEFYHRTRRIFYDTDNLLDEQKEQIYRCDNCSGYRLVHSWVNSFNKSNYTTYVVIIPRDACPGCVKRAEERWQEKQKSGGYDYIFLQDLVNERYERVPKYQVSLP
ncbi:MAG: Histone deacetylase [Clostridiales bacterium]|jgi:acetoin utilization deacetylase AcuC-like enzyme|nr:Histone deacetylase [Clostridiales bacterium]